MSQSALFGLPTPPDTVSTATDASLTAKRIAFCWNDEPLKHVVPLFDEHGQGANRSASARLMYRGHFHVPIGAGSTMERFECVIKTAFYAEGELPCEEDLASIQRECEVYALLREGTGKNNKNGCVTCHAADPEYRYLVLEHYGRDLRALLETQIKFPSAVVEAIATAVAALHEHGIMHGDIKPQNILYTFSDAEGYVMKLCDLDSAHRVGDTCAAAAVGTEGYFSPELCQARRDGTTITAAVEFDLFSLGLVLWQVLERSIASPLPAASAPGDALSLCYRDQNYLWGKLAMGAGIKAYTPAVRELTHLEPQHRMSSRQLCIFLQKQSQPYLHQELQRVIDENAKLLQDKSFLQNSVHNKLDAIRRDLAGQLTEMTDMLHTLIQGTHNIPTLAVIVPEVAESSFHFFENPMHLIKNHFRLYFLCSHTHQVAHCGPAKKGYEITVTREWVKKAAPVIRTGLLLLKLAAMAGGLPIPIPDISPLLQDANKHSEYLAAALCLVENPLSDSAPATLKLTKVLKSSNGEKDSLGAVAQHGAGDTGVTLEENSLKAYDTIQGVLTEKGVDISSTCGLRKVTCKGKTAWVLDDDATERQFRESLTN